MMENKYFVIPSDKNIKKVHEFNFLFPLKGFCVGKTCEFDLTELPDDSCIYINRILDDDGISELDQILSKNSKKIKEIFFEDLGVLELIKDKNYSFSTTYYPSHALCSLVTCKEFLNECDRVVLSSDISFDDVNEMGKLDNIGAVIYTKLPFMYSRRHLVSNYEKAHDLTNSKKIKVKNKIGNEELIFDENELGTLVYDAKTYDGSELLDVDLSFYIIDLSYDDVNDYEKWFHDYIIDKKMLDASTGFLHRESIVKLPPKEATK